MLKATVFILVVLTGFSSSVVFAQREKDDSLSLNKWSPSIITDATGAVVGNPGVTSIDPRMDHIEYINKKNITSPVDPELDCFEAANPWYKIKNKDGSVFNAIPSTYPSDFPDGDSVYLYWAARSWEIADYKKALDTMRLYVEQHPFAIYYPGEVLDAITRTVSYTGNLPKHSKNDFINEYNWLVQIINLNSERAYFGRVLIALAATLNRIDRNEAANMWYNYSLQFPDSSNVAWAMSEIKSIRDYQKLIPEDTTPFHVLHFPLQPLLGIPGRHIFSSGEEIIISLSPNPATKSTTLQYILPVRAYSNISLYDNLGRNLRTIASELDESGEHSIEIDTHDLTQGTYYVRTESNNQVITKMLVIER
jgi:hypothetical protein